CSGCGGETCRTQRGRTRTRLSSVLPDLHLPQSQWGPTSRGSPKPRSWGRTNPPSLCPQVRRRFLASSSGPLSSSPFTRSTCISVSTALQKSSATLCVSSSSFPSTPSIPGSACSSSPTTSSMCTLTPSGTATK
ncbi:hypothetical protein XENOCAPTIV_022986, partial [Xenoophorus captivus]